MYYKNTMGGGEYLLDKLVIESEFEQNLAQRRIRYVQFEMSAYYC